MRFAAIADILGNLGALAAVPADIDREGIVDVVNLGDHVSAPLKAARTADMQMERGFIPVRGGRDCRLFELWNGGLGR